MIKKSSLKQFFDNLTFVYNLRWWQNESENEGQSTDLHFSRAAQIVIILARNFTT